MASARGKSWSSTRVACQVWGAVSVGSASTTRETDRGWSRKPGDKFTGQFDAFHAEPGPSRDGTDRRLPRQPLVGNRFLIVLSLWPSVGCGGVVGLRTPSRGPLQGPASHLSANPSRGPHGFAYAGLGGSRGVCATHFRPRHDA